MEDKKTKSKQQEIETDLITKNYINVFYQLWREWSGEEMKECECQVDGSGKDAAGKEWRWTYSEIFGPLFLGKKGRELSRQPGGRSKVWDLIFKWEKERGIK